MRQRAAWKNVAHRLLFANYAAFLAIGSRNREYYLTHGVDPSRIFDSPYGVENERFPEIDRGARGGPFRFLFCGKLESKKRPLDVVEAAARLARRSDAGTFEVWFAGDGELRAEAQARVDEDALPVRFLGFVNQTELAEVYASVDCLLLPSDSGETWGLVVNEAMATGLPAIVSDEVGCAVDLVEPGRTGFVFPLGDVDALARHMDSMMRSPADARAMGREGAARVRTRHSPERVAGSVLDAVRMIAG